MKKMMKQLTILTAGVAAGAMAWAPSAHAADGLTVTVGSATITEGASGMARVPLTLSAAAPVGGICLSVAVGGSGDSARENDDYVWAGSLITMAEGETTSSVLIPIVDDLEPELAKTISVNVQQIECPGARSAASVQVQSLGVGTVTVLDNDNLPETGGSASLAWYGLGSLALGAAVMAAGRRRQRLA